MKKVMDVLKTLTERSRPCEFCYLYEIDEFKYGPLFQRGGIVAHYYCVLFSYKMQQRGEDDEGILGFLIEDIVTELNRVKKVFCFYCKKPNASISCCTRKCMLKFHYPCGIANGTLHQFRDSFRSYCFKHRPVQEIPENIIQKAEEDQVLCAICYDSIDYRSVTDTIWSNCCRTWYHRVCLQRHALSSGYFFKCAICSNKKKFKNWVEKYGIFVPQKDASWELEPNAFNELSRQYGRCDATECKCPNGRDCDIVDTMWEVILCRSCGSQGVHIMCGVLKFHKPLWQCSLCKTVTLKIRSERMSRGSKRKSGGSSDSGEDKRRDQSEEIREGDCSTSSGNEKNSTGNGISSKMVRRRGQQRKRKRSDAEDGEKCFKRNYKLANIHAVDNHAKSDTEQDGSEKASKLNVDLGTLRIMDVEIEKIVNEVDEKPKNCDEEDEDSEDADDKFSLEEITRRQKIEEHGSVVVDLTRPPPITEEEVMEVMRVYRNYQMTDMKYRVKKEIPSASEDETEKVEVIGNEEPHDSETEIATEHHLNKRYRKGSSTLDISLTMRFHVGRSDTSVKRSKSAAEKPLSRISNTLKRSDRRTDGLVGDGRCPFVAARNGLSNPVDPADFADVSIMGDAGRESRVTPHLAATSSDDDPRITALPVNKLEALKSFEKEIENMIQKCLMRNKRKTKRKKPKSQTNVECSGGIGNSLGGVGDEGDDIEVIEVVTGGNDVIGSGRKKLEQSIQSSAGDDDVIQIE